MKLPQRVTWLVQTARAAVLATALGCLDLSTNPDELLSISFDGFPSPAVVAGDTLRDTLGLVAAPRAVAFSAKGDTLPVKARFIVLDTALARFDSTTGFIIAKTTRGSARVVADFAGLQSSITTLEVTTHPDTVMRSDSFQVFSYDPSDTRQNVSANTTTQTAGVKVEHDSAGTHIGVNKWSVSFGIEYHGALLSDTTLAYPVDDGGRLSRWDTTSTDGTASRKVRLHPSKLMKTVDTLVVIATVRRPGGAMVPGSPQRFVLPVQPK